MHSDPIPNPGNPGPAPTLSLAQAQAVVATKTAPRVTEESITAKIASVCYIQEGDTGLTVCIITMRNGWMSTGISAPASLANYDPEVGKRYAYDNAFKPLWQLEGYLLRERLAADARWEAAEAAAGRRPEVRRPYE